MKKKLEENLLRYAREIRIAAGMESARQIEEMLVTRAENIEKILYSTEAIGTYRTSQGNRFDHMNRKRSELRMKARAFYEAASIANKIWRLAGRDEL